MYVDITSFFFDGIAWHRATLICANLQPLHFGRFQVVQPAGGATAHLSNPCEWGDFALATGGAWQGLRKHDFLPGRCVQTEDTKTQRKWPDLLNLIDSY